MWICSGSSLLNEGFHMNTTIQDENGAATRQGSSCFEGVDVNDDDGALEAIPPIKSLFISRLMEKTTAEKVFKNILKLKDINKEEGGTSDNLSNMRAVLHSIKKSIVKSYNHVTYGVYRKLFTIYMY